MVRPAGFEPATFALEGHRSIQLSYGRLCMYSLRSIARKFYTTIPKRTTIKAIVLFNIWKIIPGHIDFVLIKRIFSTRDNIKSGIIDWNSK
jgi:hypothetical protein